MAIIKVKATSPGRRGLEKVVTPGLHKGKPYSPLLQKKIRGSGRNSSGRITVRHQGGGLYKSYCCNTKHTTITQLTVK